MHGGLGSGRGRFGKEQAGAGVVAAMDDLQRPVDEMAAAGAPSFLGSGPLLAPGSGGDLLAVRGHAPLEALHRLVSQDVRALAPGESALALVLAPKGQVRGIMAVFPRTEDVLLLAPAGAGMGLAGELNRYLVLSRCRAEVLDTAAAVTILGERWAALAGAGAAEDLEGAGAGLVVDGQGEQEVWWLGRTLLGLSGAVAVAPREPGAQRLASLTARVPRVAGEVVELERIRRGWPTWGREITGTTLPPEVGLDRHAVSFTKGCYVGQETMARIDAYGHVNRALAGVIQEEGPGDLPDLPLGLAAVAGDRVRGQLTSAAVHPDHGVVGLALVRREFAQDGAVLHGGGRRFRVAAHPLW